MHQNTTGKYSTLCLVVGCGVKWVEEKGSRRVSDSLAQTKGGVVYGTWCHAHPIPVMPRPLIARTRTRRTYAYTRADSIIIAHEKLSVRPMGLS